MTIKVFPILSVIKTLYPTIVHLVMIINFSVVSAMSNNMVKNLRRLDKRSGEHLGVPPLTRKKVKSSNNSASCDHLLHFFTLF